MSVYFQDDTLTLHIGHARDVLATMDDGSVNCVVTSPPYYGLRDYEGNGDQIGMEDTPQAYVSALLAVFTEVHRVLADDGTLWLNLGDSYVHGGSGKQGASGARADRSFTADRVPGCHALPAKNLLGIPWRVAFALQDAGWFLRNAIAWHKPNAMPEAVTDRLSNRHEVIFLLTKGPKYWFDLDAVRQPATTRTGRLTWSERKDAGETTSYGIAGHASVSTCGFVPNAKGANPGDVWTIATTPLPDAHFAAFPVELPRRCIASGCKPGGTVLDPFSGAGTTAIAAQQLGRKAVGVDVNASYHDIALKRMADAPLPLLDGEAS